MIARLPKFAETAHNLAATSRVVFVGNDAPTSTISFCANLVIRETAQLGSSAGLTIEQAMARAICLFHCRRSLEESGMSHRAWAYISSVFLAAVVLSGLALPGLAIALPQWHTFAALVLLATIAQLFKAVAPKHQLYYTTPVFFFAGVLLLDPAFFLLLVTIPLLVEWTRERLTDSPYLRDWYLQPFNMATYIIAAFGAHWAASALDAYTTIFFFPASVFAAMIAAFAYVAINHVLVGLALVVLRGVSWRDSGTLDSANLTSELVLLCIGYTVALLWKQNPWLTLPALAPLVLLYRALLIPQLKKEAQTDGKTGLLNAHHFSSLLTTELERAKRFERPMAFIMGDLDLLRNINNTYGHLAGDVVLAGIGQLIRTTIRDYDIAGRFGGEEFAIVLPEAGLGEAQAFAERLRHMIGEAHFEVRTSPTPIQVTMSLGIACFPSDALTATDLIHEADIAVYQAKLKGRNRIVCAADVPYTVRVVPMPVEDQRVVTHVPVPAVEARAVAEDHATHSR
jgi:diguanylate cyclase (GGDEF)-like protein